MTRSPSAWPAGVTVDREAYDADGPAVGGARAEAELVVRYGSLDDSELGTRRRPCSSRPTGPSSSPARRCRAAARSRGVGCAGVGGPRVGRGPAPVGRPGLAGPGRRAGASWRRSRTRPRALGFSDAASSGPATASPRRSALYESTGWERHQVDADGRPLPAGHIRFTKLPSLSGP